MTEAEYISQIRQRIREEGRIFNDSFDLLRAALAEYPDSPSLWCLRGDMIQLSDEDAGCSLDDVLPSYEKALDLDPNCGEAYESIGYFYDKVLDAPAIAEAYFRTALERGGGESAARGLRDVVEELKGTP